MGIYIIRINKLYSYYKLNFQIPKYIILIINYHTKKNKTLIVEHLSIQLLESIVKKYDV